MDSLRRKTTLKTYGHLADEQRVPSDYDLGSRDLLPYLRSGKFELDLPVTRWYKTHQTRSQLNCEDWEAFSDPSELTYSKYTEKRAVSEQFVDKIFSMIDEQGGDKTLDPSWLELLENVFAPMRYPFHAFQMVASYVGQMAPSSRIAICCLFQSADEMRLIQRIAYRMGQIRQHHPSFGEQSRRVWEQDEIWQEIRKIVESLLVTYDWGEAFCALNLVLKPTLEPIMIREFPRLGVRCGDEHLASVFSSLAEESDWHSEWSDHLVAVAVESNPKDASVIEQWREKWQLLADPAEQQFRDMLYKIFS